MAVDDSAYDMSEVNLSGEDIVAAILFIIIIYLNCMVHTILVVIPLYLSKSDSLVVGGVNLV